MAEVNSTTEPAEAPPSDLVGNDYGLLPLTPEMLADVMRDWNWYHDNIENGTFDQYAGEHVAILNQCVVGHSEDRIALVRDTAEALGCQPNRLAVPYIDKWFF